MSTLRRDDEIRWGSGRARRLIGHGFPGIVPEQPDPKVLAGPGGPFCGLKPDSQIPTTEDENAADKL